MVAYANTAIALGSSKNALLYFDHIVPLSACGVLLGREIVKKLYCSAPLPDESLFGGLDDILPPSLRSTGFAARLALVSVEICRFAVEAIGHVGLECALSRGGLDSALSGSGLSDSELVKNTATVFYQFVNDFRLGGLPLDVGGSLPTGKPEPEPETVISLASLDLIDGERASWEQIKEFRRDVEARDRLRRLRLFAYANYQGKSKDFVADDILTRIADYEAAVKKWGFETAQGALNMLLTSKVFGGALAGSLLSTLFGAPTIAVVAAASGGALEIGRITLEITKQRLALRSLMRENPVSFISYAREKLGVSYAREKLGIFDLPPNKREDIEKVMAAIPNFLGERGNEETCGFFGDWSGSGGRAARPGDDEKRRCESAAAALASKKAINKHGRIGGIQSETWFGPNTRFSP
jgi:hypothetical protein